MSLQEIESRPLRRGDVDLILAIAETPGTHTQAALAGWEYPITREGIALQQAIAAQTSLLVTLHQALAGVEKAEFSVDPLLPFNMPEPERAKPDVTDAERARLEALLDEFSFSPD